MKLGQTCQRRSNRRLRGSPHVRWGEESWDPWLRVGRSGVCKCSSCILHLHLVLLGSTATSWGTGDRAPVNQAIGEYTPSTICLSALSYINPEKNPSNVQVLPLTPVKCGVLTVQLFWQDWISFHSSVVNGSIPVKLRE